MRLGKLTTQHFRISMDNHSVVEYSIYVLHHAIARKLQEDGVKVKLSL
jgi:hypothetical protein